VPPVRMRVAQPSPAHSAKGDGPRRSARASELGREAYENLTIEVTEERRVTQEKGTPRALCVLCGWALHSARSKLLDADPASPLKTKGTAVLPETTGAVGSTFSHPKP
jgi:hypothetical protein